MVTVKILKIEKSSENSYQRENVNDKNNLKNKKNLASLFLTDDKSSRFFSQKVNTRMSVYAQ